VTAVPTLTDAAVIYSQSKNITSQLEPYQAKLPASPCSAGQHLSCNGGPQCPGFKVELQALRREVWFLLVSEYLSGQDTVRAAKRAPHTRPKRRNAGLWQLATAHSVQRLDELVVSPCLYTTVRSNDASIRVPQRGLWKQNRRAEAAAGALLVETGGNWKKSPQNTTWIPPIGRLAPRARCAILSTICARKKKQ
jgi:hypothetical protein